MSKTVACTHAYWGSKHISVFYVFDWPQLLCASHARADCLTFDRYPAHSLLFTPHREYLQNIYVQFSRIQKSVAFEAADAENVIFILHFDVVQCSALKVHSVCSHFICYYVWYFYGLQFVFGLECDGNMTLISI